MDHFKVSSWNTHDWGSENKLGIKKCHHQELNLLCPVENVPNILEMDITETNMKKVLIQDITTL
jgi:hypothetical protein